MPIYYSNTNIIGEAMNSQNENNQNENNSVSDITLFVKIGIIVLTILAVIGLGIKYIPEAITVSNIGKKRDLPIYCVATDENKVALSFDAAWGNEDTQTILDILAKHDVKVTFFMTGEWMGKYPDDVKKFVAAGHDVGNHSENHKQMSRLTEQQCRDEIMKAHKRIKELTGIDMDLFRPPYGDYNNMVVGTARDLGYYTIQWDVDSLDWKDYGADSIVKKCTEHKNLGKGSIILMHNGAKYTPEALERVITGLKDKGYELVPISQLIHRGEYTIDHTGRQLEK